MVVPMDCDNPPPLLSSPSLCQMFARIRYCGYVLRLHPWLHLTLSAALKRSCREDVNKAGYVNVFSRAREQGATGLAQGATAGAALQRPQSRTYYRTRQAHQLQSVRAFIKATLQERSEIHCRRVIML